MIKWRVRYYDQSLRVKRAFSLGTELPLLTQNPYTLKLFLKMRKCCGYCGQFYCVGYELRLSEECILLFFNGLKKDMKERIIRSWIK